MSSELEQEKEHSEFLEKLLAALYGLGWEYLTIADAKRCKVIRDLEATHRPTFDQWWCGRGYKGFDYPPTIKDVIQWIEETNQNGLRRRTMSEREIVFWDFEDEEHLSHADLDEAIEAILENSDEVEGSIELCGYAHMEKPPVELVAEHILENVLEYLDCNYDLGSPDDATEPTETMRDAATVFAASILKDYTPWTCEAVKKETIDVKAWIAANKPEWLKETNDVNQ